ncbi:hypothetical protein [Listeria cornellensis]|uniref:Orn/Lys/Arg family decarboxylase n=1 Tax=Listeria cornellensis TaxID=1494961 RepID=UPI003B97EA3F
MASLDYARHYVGNYNKQDTEAFQKMRTDWLIWLQKNKLTIITPDDPLKLIVRKDGLSGFDLQTVFEQADYYPELADTNNVLLTLPLIKDVMEFPTPTTELKWEDVRFGTSNPPNPIAIPPIIRIQAFNTSRPTYFERLEHTIGKTVAEMVIPYPPGIPIILAGEIITVAHIEMLLRVKQHHYQGGEKLHEDRLKIFYIDILVLI